MFSNEIKHQSLFGEIKHSYAYEKFSFKGQTKGIALKYVKEGCEKYLINEQVIDVEQGQFILVQEGQIYEAQAKLKFQNISGLCIDLNPEAFDIDLTKIYDNPLLFNLPFDCFHFSPLVKKLHTIHSNKALRSHTEQYDILKILNEQVHIFANEISELQARLSIQTGKTNTQRAIIIKLLASKNFIHQYFYQKIKLEQLAKYAGISKYHFVRLFKLCFQQSPLELQDKLRMKKAIELINNPMTKLSDIAYDLGFIDLASFSKKFKKQYGTTPSQYRKMIN